MDPYPRLLQFRRPIGIAPEVLTRVAVSETEDVPELVQQRQD